MGSRDRFYTTQGELTGQHGVGKTTAASAKTAAS
jgi:hypothetical protein